MKDGKAKRLLEEKQQRLRSQIEAAEKLLDQVPGPELLRVLGKVGIRARDVARGHLHFDLKGVRAFTGSERKLFSVWLNLILDLAKDRCDFEEIELLLHPAMGRTAGSRNKEPRRVDPAIAPALLEWESLAASKPASERTIAHWLAFKHCPVKTGEARDMFAERLRAAWRSGKRVR